MEKMMIGGTGEYRTQDGKKATVLYTDYKCAFGYCDDTPCVWFKPTGAVLHHHGGRLDIVGPWPEPQARKPVEGFVVHGEFYHTEEHARDRAAELSKLLPSIIFAPVREVLPGELVVPPIAAREVISEIDAMLFSFEHEGGGGTLPGRLQRIRELLTGMESSK